MRAILLFTFLLSSIAAFAQDQPALPDAPVPAQVATLDPAIQQASPAEQTASSSSSSNQADSDQQSGTVDASKRQPKRILGIMPNYRAVSAGAIPPPPSPKQAFGIATRNSFDYSAFIFTGLTSMIAEGQDSHPQLGKGIPGFWAYSWRGFVDKTDGNYLVIFALPTVFHEDGRYFAKGQGSILHRAVYASSRVLITKKYDGDSTFNFSEVLGRAGAQGISTSYYPSQSRTAGELSEKFAYSLMRDALTNTFREFWPDIATHVLHQHQ